MRFLETVFKLVEIYGLFSVVSFKSTSSELGVGEKGLGYGEGVKSALFVYGVFEALLNIYIFLRIDFPFSEYLYLI